MESQFAIQHFNMNKFYTIWLPPFDITSGGIRVMWGLYGWLLAKGCIVFPNVIADNDNFIAIYPEIVNGNPLKAKTVVRYILNKPGAMMGYGQPGPTTYPESDHKFIFSKIFDTFGVDDDHLLFLPIVNLHVFKDQGKKRTKTAYLVGKGINTQVHPKDSVYINRPLAYDQQALADLLNECHTFYSYDPVTAMFEIARLCGCRVVVVPNGSYSNEEMHSYEPGFNGISWGINEKVELDTKAFRKHYEGMVDTFSKKLDKFIDITQNG